MPIAAALAYVQGLLDNLPMPDTAPAMAAYVVPPDPNVETQIPTAYVWPSAGRESRDPKNAGSMPRNSGPGAPSGFKAIVHSVDIWIVWMAANDDPLFPGIVDAAMQALRTSSPNPAIVTDPYTGLETLVADVGETQDYKIAVSALADEAFSRYDALLTLPVTEVLQA